MSIISKITQPILGQLKQGVTPHKLALSIAIGLLIGIMPILGLSTTLCLVAAYFLGLNHIAIQSVNYAAYPLQIIMIIPFVRMGEWILGRKKTPLDITTILHQMQDNLKIAFQKYFFLGLVGLLAWAILAPVILSIIYFLSKFVLTKALRK